MTPALSMLSYGAGQDSETIRLRLIFDPGFRAKYAPGRLLIICSDTGDEHDETYEHIEWVKEDCVRHGIEFVHLTPDMGYHSKSWQSLQGFYDLKKAVGSKAFPKTCTDKLKVKPIYSFLEDWVGREYGYKAGRKKALIAFAKEHGKINVLIGIAKGEESRMMDQRKVTEKWRRASIRIVYPLVKLGLDRAGCQKYIASTGNKIPLPSNCRRCPFLSEQELVWMHRFTPDVYHDWVRQEQVKMENNMHLGDRNLGVWGKKTLPQVLTGALAKYGHWSDADLQDYKMSHGHCVNSRY